MDVVEETLNTLGGHDYFIQIAAKTRTYLTNPHQRRRYDDVIIDKIKDLIGDIHRRYGITEQDITGAIGAANLHDTFRKALLLSDNPLLVEALGYAANLHYQQNSLRTHNPISPWQTTANTIDYLYRRQSQRIAESNKEVTLPAWVIHDAT